MTFSRREYHYMVLTFQALQFIYCSAERQSAEWRSGKCRGAFKCLPKLTNSGACTVKPFRVVIL
jgi:hypothetical protein